MSDFLPHPAFVFLFEQPLLCTNRKWCHGLLLFLMVASYFLENFQDEALIEVIYMLSLLLVPLCG